VEVRPGAVWTKQAEHSRVDIQRHVTQSNMSSVPVALDQFEPSPEFAMKIDAGKRLFARRFDRASVQIRQLRI